MVTTLCLKLNIKTFDLISILQFMTNPFLCLGGDLFMKFSKQY